MRRVLRLTERSIDKHGQVLLEPELTLEGWTTRDRKSTRLNSSHSS